MTLNEKQMEIANSMIDSVNRIARRLCIAHGVKPASRTQVLMVLDAYLALKQEAKENESGN